MIIQMTGLFAIFATVNGASKCEFFDAKQIKKCLNPEI